MNKKIFLVLSLMVVLILIGTTWYFYYKYRQVEQMLQISLASNPVPETGSLIEKIAQPTYIPPDEEPMVIRIKDIDKVKDQPFFANGKNGDILFIFKKTKLALLYDPAENKIIQSGPLMLATQSATISPESSP